MSVTGVSYPPIVPSKTLSKTRSKTDISFKSDSLHFQGKSEVPDILPKKPTGLWERFKAFLSEIVTTIKNWLNPMYVLRRFWSWRLNRQAKHVLSQLKAVTPDKAKEIMAKPPLEKITYQQPVRLSTGIAKASEHYGPKHQTMKDHKDPQSMRIVAGYDIHWSPFKVARDALQNFYDGQGQTLDGVKIDIKPGNDGKQRVKISASATYDVDKLLALGSTTKKGQAATAGGFGEGAKVMALMLLRDYGADKVTFRSREWQADFTLDRDAKDKNARRLMVQLMPLNPPIKGNNLEFETSDQDLIATIKDGQKLFYNPKNEIFENPTYENSTGGFKLLNAANAPGRVYEAGQLRAFGHDGHYDAIPGLVVWSNKKILDLNDRDRIAIQSRDVQTILQSVVNGMSQEEAAQGIQTLRKHWFYQKPEDLLSDNFNRRDDKSAAELLLNAYCQRYRQLSSTKPDFLPDCLVSVSPNELMGGEEGVDQLKTLYKDGYIPVNPVLEQVGVPNGASVLMSRDALLEKKVTKLDTLTPPQQGKVATMTQTLQSLAGALSAQGYYKANEVKKLSQLPVKVVKYPDSIAYTPPIKVSSDERSLWVDQRFLAEASFAEFINQVEKIATIGYLASDEQVKWIVENLSQIEQLKANWDKKDER